MYKFLVFKDGQVPEQWPVRNGHLLGNDGNAMAADIAWQDGALCVTKKEAGVCAFALQHKVGDLGELTLQTTLLPEREEPYILTLELARHRLMMLYMRLEEWSMFDLGEDHAVNVRLKRARSLFIEALSQQVSSPSAAHQLAQESLINAIDGTEELTLAHAELLLERRRVTGSVPKYALGCGICLEQHDPRILGGLQANFEVLNIPMPWKTLVPTEGEYQFQATDPWVQWALAAKRKIVAGPIIDFSKGQAPDWLYIWEHDYDTVRDLVYEHIKQVVGRYRSTVHVWNLMSGLNVNAQFSFSYEQLVDLVRMSALLVRKLAPKAQIMLEIDQPWGEYHGANPRSMAPLRFCELLSQSSVPFDVIGLRLFMGQAMPGRYARDMMQISAVIDHFGHQGKPLHVSFAAPSEPVTLQMLNAMPDKAKTFTDDQCGYWRRPWSGLIQGRWLEACMHIAMSRPYVESVSWHDVLDHVGMPVLLSGLVDDQLRPKKVFKHAIRFREYLRGSSSDSSAASAPAIAASGIIQPRTGGTVPASPAKPSA